MSAARERRSPRCCLPHSHIANPLDLTWAGLYDASIARRCVEALGGQPDVGLVVLLQDAPRGLGMQQANRYATLLCAVADGAADAGLPAVAVSNLCSDMHPDYARTAAEKSVRQPARHQRRASRAIGHVLRWQTAALSDERSPGSHAIADAAREGRWRRWQADATGARSSTSTRPRRCWRPMGMPDPAASGS